MAGRFGVGEMDRVRAFAKQLDELNPDVVVCETAPTLKVLAQQTASLPIVIVSVADPVNDGYVADLAVCTENLGSGVVMVKSAQDSA